MHMNMKNLPSLPLCGFFIASLLTSLAPAQIISVNIAGAATGDTAVDGTETFGVAELDTVVGHWTNVVATTAGSTAAPVTVSATGLAWSDGTASTVDFSAQYAAAVGNIAAAGYINTPLKYGLAHYPITDDTKGTTFTVTNLNANFANGYYVIVYLSGFATNDGASVTAGGTTYYYRSPDLPSTPLSSLVLTTSTVFPAAANDAPIAEYALFGSTGSPLSADSFTVDLDALYGGPILAGLQIVGIPPSSPSVPEPATYALLLGLATAGFVAFRRISRR